MKTNKYSKLDPMKKLLLVLLFVCGQQIAGAQDWSKTSWDADELTEREAYDSYRYTDEIGNSFVFWSNSDADFRIISALGIFDYEGANHNFWALIGLYDENDELLEKFEIRFLAVEGMGNQAEANLTPFRRPIPNPERCRKLLQFLTQRQGYARIVAPLFGTNNKFDLTVPCMVQ